MDHVGGDYDVVLVAGDRKTRMTVSHMVPVNGGDHEWFAEQLTRDILMLGLQGDVTLRSDQELAIVDLLKRVAKLGGVERTFLEHHEPCSRRQGWKNRCSKNEREKLRTVCLGVWVRRCVSRLRKGGRSLYVKEMVLWLLAGKEIGHRGSTWS